MVIIISVQVVSLLFRAFDGINFSYKTLHFIKIVILQLVGNLRRPLNLERVVYVLNVREEILHSLRPHHDFVTIVHINVNNVYPDKYERMQTNE